MNINTGEIKDFVDLTKAEKAGEWIAITDKEAMLMKVVPLKERRLWLKNKMRNQLCPCDSGRKFKKCCRSTLYAMAKRNK